MVRHLLIAAAAATYLFDRDNVVWRFIKDSPARTELEHGCFLFATLLIGVGAALCTRASASPGFDNAGSRQILRNPRYLGELLYTTGLAFLMPLTGFVLLIAGESIRIFRLARRQDHQAAESTRLGWGKAIRKQAAKWGLFLTAMIFTVTLIDRLAEYLAGASVIVWAVLNLPLLRSRSTSDVPE